MLNVNSGHVTKSTRWRVWWLPLLFSSMLAGGCAKAQPKRSGVVKPIHRVQLKPGEFPWAATKPNQKVVARVNGVPITENALMALMRKNPEISRNVAFNRLVEEEILAQHAYAGGYAKTPGVARLLKKRAVKRFLKEKFEKEISLEDVPMYWLRIAWHKRRGNHYIHPDGFYMLTLTATCCRKAPEPLSCLDTPSALTSQKRTAPVFFGFVGCLLEIEDRTRRFMQHVRDRWGAHLSSEADFKALEKFYRMQPFFLGAKRYHAWYDFSLKDQSKARYQRFADAFTRAFIVLDAGGLSPVVRSRFGFHLIRMENHLPKRNRQFAQVSQELRKFLFPNYQTWAARNYLGKDLKGIYDTTFNDKVLELLLQRR